MWIVHEYDLYEVVSDLYEIMSVFVNLEIFMTRW